MLITVVNQQPGKRVADIGMSPKLRNCGLVDHDPLDMLCLQGDTVIEQVAGFCRKTENFV